MGISLKELKKNRLTPAERWVLERIDGCVPKTYSNGVVYWYKDGKHLFTQDFKNGYLWVSYKYIWSVLEEEFGLNYNEIQELIKNVMYDYTDKGKLKIKYTYLKKYLKIFGNLK